MGAAETSMPLLLVENTDKAVTVRSTRRALVLIVVIMMAMRRGGEMYLFLVDSSASSLTSCLS